MNKEMVMLTGGPKTLVKEVKRKKVKLKNTLFKFSMY